MMISNMYWQPHYQMLCSFLLLTTITAWAGPPSPVDRPRFANDTVVIKLRESALTLMGDTEKMPSRELTERLPVPLRKLNQTLGLREIKPVFKNAVTQQRRTEALEKIIKRNAKLTAEEAHLALRMRRAPAGVKPPRLDAWFKVKLDPARFQSVEQAVDFYQRDPAVEIAEPDYSITLDDESRLNTPGAAMPGKQPTEIHPAAVVAIKTPNDPFYSQMWPLNNTGQLYPTSGRYTPPPGTPDCDIDAPEAWATATGSPNIIVAVIDTGVDLTHRDLQGNLWINAAEQNGKPGVDDDGNGYIDDIYGYDFFARKPTPADDNGHGTHCAGTIAARGNNGLDITGICWNARIMALKFLNADGFGMVTNSAQAFQYAADKGADVVSCSFGSSTTSQVEQDAIRYAISHGVAVVAAAGNNATSAESYPAAVPGVIAVAATDSRDQMAAFTNYGPWVDVSAPGVDILSLLAKGTRLSTPYTSSTLVLSGTSMACPHVAGMAALILSQKPALSIDQLSGLLKLTADRKSSPHYIGDGRVNLAAALAETNLPLTCRLDPPMLLSNSQSGYISGKVNLRGSASGKLFTSYTLSYGAGRDPAVWKKIVTRTTAVTSGSLYDTFDTMQVPDGPCTFKLEVADQRGRKISDSKAIFIQNIKSTYPMANDILKPGGTLDLTVTAWADQLVADVIEWGIGITPTTWSTQGITKLDGKNGLMGRWNTAFITCNNFYTLRIQFHTASAAKGTVYLRSIYMDTRLKGGWPQYVPTTRLFADSLYPTVADLDNDGHKEIICMEMGETWYSYKSPAVRIYRDNGQLLKKIDLVPGDTSFSSYGKTLSPPLIGDLDGDLKKEIILTSGCQKSNAQGKVSRVYAFRCDGTPMPGWPVDLEVGFYDKLMADVDHDGRQEIILQEVQGSAPMNLVILGSEGKIKKKIPMGSLKVFWSPEKSQGLAVGNFDDAPELEIAAILFDSSSSDNIQQPVIMKWDGTRLPGWPQSASKPSIINAMIAVDVNHDGYDELIYLAGSDSSNKGNQGLFLVDRHGTPLPGWPVMTDIHNDDVRYCMSVSAGDLNGDGQVEIAVTNQRRAIVDVYNLHGDHLPGWPVHMNGYNASRCQPLLADITGDGKPDIVCAGGGLDTTSAILNFNKSGGVFAWQSNGTPIKLCPENSAYAPIWMEGIDTHAYSSPGEMIITDLDHNGKVDLVGSSCNDMAGPENERCKWRNSIYVWELPVKWDPLKMEWPCWQHDPAATGRYAIPRNMARPAWGQYR